MNHLVTGPPRSGKTTVLERVRERLEAGGLTVGGVVTPERRVDGDRVAFACRALDTGETATIASVDRDTGPRVGTYRVDVAAIDEVAAPAIERATGRDGTAGADAVLIDEVAPMQRYSDRFLAATQAALAAGVPVVAAVASGDDLLAHPDTTVHEVTPENRDDLPAVISSSFQM